VAFTDDNIRECMEQMVTQCIERFERRLAEETAALRVEMAHLETGLRGDMARLETGMRGDMASLRAELLKWAFLFWVGQLAGVAAIVGIMLQTLPR
jgi:hypothetical protein